VAVKGVDTIEHSASLFHMKADDPDGMSQFTTSHIKPHYYWVLELIVPAVKGTFSILQSALKYGCAYLADKF
jgi:hypothetical protein